MGMMPRIPSSSMLPTQAQAQALTRVSQRVNNADFYRWLRRSMDPAATTGQPGGNPPAPGATTPAPPQVVQSPFNVLGLPVSSTPAPTPAEVAASPQKFAGTSFDPARQIRWPWMQQPAAGNTEEASPAGYGLGYGWTPQMYAAHHNPLVPPSGSAATTNPNVFTMPSGATWIRPGSA